MARAICFFLAVLLSRPAFALLAPGLCSYSDCLQLRPATSRCPNWLATAPKGDEPEDSGIPSSFDPSRDLAAYQRRRSKGSAARFAITQAGPLRRGVAAIDDALGGLGSIFQFYKGATAAISIHKALLLLTLAAFGAQSAAGRAATMAGARMNNAILYGDQWHRLVTPIFLHGGGYHLLSNSYSLWRVGPLVERLYGGSRMLLVYIIAGIGGNVAGLFFGNPRSISVGASGAVLGLMGAVAAYVTRNKRELGSSGDALLTQVGQLLLLNLFIGMSPRSGIDNLGHAGGAAAGFVFGWLLSPRISRSYDAEGDGAIMPPPIERGLLGAALAATVLSVRAGVKLTLALRAVVR